MLLLALAGSTAMAQYSLSETEKRWLAEKTEIIFAGQISYPPFEFIHPRYGDYTGMAIDLIRWIATEYGFTVVFRPMPFAAAQQAVTTGTADALTGIFESDERKKRFDFTDQVFAVPASIFVRSERTDILEIGDLAGRKIAVQRGDYAIEFLDNKNIAVEWIYTSDFSAALNLVANGEADALIGDEQIVLHYMYNAKLQDRIKKTAEPLYTGKDCMAVAKGNSILLSILQKGLHKAQQTGVLDTIYRKWLGVAYSSQNMTMDRWRLPILTALIIMVLLSMLILVWTMQLRRLVKARTSELQTLNSNLQRSNESLSYANSQLMKDMEERARMAEESRRLEGRMIKAQNNESLALMAGNIAHEFNNMLMGMIGSMEKVLSGGMTTMAEDDRTALQAAVSQAKKAGELARRMMEFAGQSAVNRVMIQLDRLMPEIEPLLLAASGTEHPIQLQLPAVPVAIRGDEQQIRQVILNLLLNAIEATGSADLPVKLSVRARDLTLADLDHTHAGHTLLPGMYATISVEDQGHGIEPELLERIFDPYYTTKRSGRGLGLAATAGIIKAHSGAILVDSQKGKGSCFTIVLPLATPGEG